MGVALLRSVHSQDNRHIPTSQEGINTIWLRTHKCAQLHTQNTHDTHTPFMQRHTDSTYASNDLTGGRLSEKDSQFIDRVPTSVQSLGSFGVA